MQRLSLTIVVACSCFLFVASDLHAQARAYVERGVSLEKRGELDKAIANYNQALQVADPGDSENISLAYYNRAIAWEKKDEVDKAIADYSQAVAHDPNYVEAYNNRGILWERKEEYDQAVADYTQALVVHPRHAFSYFNRGALWETRKEYDKAVADFTQGLAIEPSNDFAYFHRATVWRLKGDYGKTIADYNQALAINPKYLEACNSLAWLYATCPDGKYRDGAKAFEYASQAYQLGGGKYWGEFDTLAAAYAESEDFATAAEWQAKAVEMALKDKSTTDEELADARRRLELYRQGKPYREELKK